MPTQSLLDRITLLGKPKAGTRPIAAISTIHRLMMSLAGDIIGYWEDSYAGFWDKAIKGSSALRAQLGRALNIELATIKGETAMVSLWDFAKFFDSVDPTILIGKLAERNYQACLMTLGLITHGAPRIFTFCKSMPSIVQSTSTSILVGCKQPVAFTKGLMYKLVEELNNVLPRSPASACEQLVNDLSQALVHCESETIINAGFKAAIIMHTNAKELRLNISTKSISIPAQPPEVQTVQQVLTSQGIEIYIQNEGANFGISVNAGETES